MSLVTRLQTMSAPDLLRWIGGSRKTGVLRLSRRAIEKRLLVQDGLVYSTWSNEQREYLREFLLREGLVSAERIDEARVEEEHRDPRRLYGLILVEQGAIEEGELRRVLEHKAKESICEVFAWPDGKAEFDDGAISGDVFVHTELQIEPLILEGARRVEELSRIKEVFPSRRTTFRVLESPEDLTEAERQMLGLVSPGKSLEQLSLETRRSRYETSVVLHRLYSAGAIDVEEPGLDTSLPTDNPTQVEIHLGIAGEALKAGNLPAALKGYQDVLLVQPGNVRAREGVAAVEQAQERELEEAPISLSSVPVVTARLPLTTQDLDATEGFVLSRINGESDIASILQVCPMAERQTLLIMARFLKQGVIELR